MKAVQVLQAGGPEALTYMDVDDPAPGPGEALVELKAAGVNYMDVYLRSGANNPTLPVIPGGEGSGIVLEVGEGVTEVAVGDRVTYTGAGRSYAEKVVAPAWRLIKVPGGLDIEDRDENALKVPGIVPKLSATPGGIRRRAPALGEHNTEILGAEGWPGDNS